MECLMDHIVLNVENEEKMIAFYSEVLQMPAERLQEYRAGAFPVCATQFKYDYRPFSKKNVAEKRSGWTGT
jgi:catechol 2,3-dioxygenase-like lactoylglutathione lyase family enzyme